MLKATIMYCTVILYPKSICQNITPLGNPHNSLEKLHPPRKYSIDTMPKQPDVKLHLQPTLPNNIHLLSTKMLVYLSYLNKQLIYYLYRNFFKDTIWCNSSCLHVFEGVTVSTKFFFSTDFVLRAILEVVAFVCLISGPPPILERSAKG